MSNRKTRKSSSRGLSRRTSRSSNAHPDDSNEDSEITKTRSSKQSVMSTNGMDWKLAAHVGAEVVVVGGIAVYFFKTTSALKIRMDEVEKKCDQAVATAGQLPGYLKVLSGKVQQLEAQNEDQAKRLLEAEEYIAQLFSIISPDEGFENPQPQPSRYPTQRVPPQRRRPPPPRPQQRSRNEDYVGSDDDECEDGVCPLPKTKSGKKVRIRDPRNRNPRNPDSGRSRIEEIRSDEEDLDAELEAELGDLRGSSRGRRPSKPRRR